MTTREEHYRKADKILATLDEIDAKLGEENGYLGPQQILNINATRDYLMKRAEIHALMAGAAVEPEEEDPTPRRGDV